MIHNLELTLVDVAEGRAVVVRCPDCGQLEIWSEDEALVDHGLCRSKGEPCWCKEVKPTRAGRCHNGLLAGD